MNLAEVQQKVLALGFDYDAQPKEAVPACNLCGYADATVLWGLDRYGCRVRSVVCPICGLVWLTPRMTPEGYAVLYGGYYRKMASIYAACDMEAESSRQSAIDSSLLDDLPHVWSKYRGGRLLDVGGSVGSFARLLVEKNAMTGTVIDPSVAESAVAGGSGLETVCTTAEQWVPGVCGEFDVVLMLRTIEHLTDPLGTLRKIRSVISPEGCLAMTVVDFQAEFKKLAEQSGIPCVAIKVDHVYNLTVAICMAFLRRAGFAVTFARPYGRSVFILGSPCEPEENAMPDAFARSRWFEELGIYEFAYC